MRDRTETWIGAWAEACARRPVLVLVSSLGVLAAFAMALPRLEARNAVEAFFHRDDPVLARYDAFRDTFGRDQLTLLAIEPPEVFDARFLARLAALHGDLEKKVRHLDEVTSLVSARSTRGTEDALIVRELLEELPATPEEVAAVRAEALGNPLYRGTVLANDGRTVAIAVQAVGRSPVDPERFLSEAELAEHVATIQMVADAHRAPDFPITLCGAPITVARLNQAMQRDLITFLAASLTLIVTVLAVVFRRVAGVVLPLAVVVLSLVATFGALAMMGMPLSVTTEILPSFLLTVGLCDAIHVLSIYDQRRAAARARLDAIREAYAHCGLGLAMTSITTAAGLLSFTSSDLAPVTHLGYGAALGVMMALAVTLTALPAALALVSWRPRKAPTSERAYLASSERVLVRLGALATRRPGLVIAGWGIVAVVFALGASRVRFSQDELAWFPAREPLRLATAAFDSRFAGSSAVELLVDTGREGGVQDPDVLSRLDALRAANDASPAGPLAVGKTLSIVDVVKEINRALAAGDPTAYRVPDDAALIAQELLLFEFSGSQDLEDWVDGRARVARVHLRVPWADSLLYPPFVEALAARTRAILGPSLSFELTGMSPLLGRIFQGVVESMTRSYVFAFAAIALLLMVLLGGVGRGSLAMIANLVPILAVLGVMGFMHIPLDIATVLIGSIVLGLAVDDTIHFAHGFFREVRRGAEPEAAATATLATTGRAMLFTTVVLACGFLVYGLATMQNVRVFGLLVSFATVIALAADVTLGPAIFALADRSRGPQDVTAAADAGAGSDSPSSRR